MENTIKLNEITILPDSREVLIDGQKIHFRKKEYELLEFLARNPEKAINRLTILEYVWNYSIHANTNTLEVHIAALRKKLLTYKKENLIQTIHGLGYALKAS
jgi:DNA-binding response OmpR family regulator